MTKTYQVIVDGLFPNKDLPLKIDSPIDGRQAISFVKTVTYQEDLKQSLLEIQIETGRKHQIRRHCADLGFPVVGDRLYGQAGINEPLQLLAYSLSFFCPIEKVIKKVVSDKVLTLSA